eukprot:m.52037 g.52037  ORF g.52037 m.52037 type:complete len:266 (+) comp10982_c0_seq1:90-887(+)
MSKSGFSSIAVENRSVVSSSSSTPSSTGLSSFSTSSVIKNKTNGAVRRQLPTPAKCGRMKRAKSLSFLPSAVDNENNENKQQRRRLPDTAQGRLIKIVSERLKEESVLRIQVAKELKEEKKLRWSAEDALAVKKREVEDLRYVVNSQSTKLKAMTEKCELQQKSYDTLSHKLEMIKRQQDTMRQKIEEAKEQERAHEEREQILDQAWSDLYRQQRENQRLQHQYDELINAMEEVQPGASKALLESIGQSASDKPNTSSSIQSFDV